MSANDMQVGGFHYQSNYQHWDYVARVLRNQYLPGQATKYIARSRKKNGLQDLEKSLHYITKIQEGDAKDLIVSAAAPIDYRFIYEETVTFGAANDLTAEEVRILVFVATEQYMLAHNYLQELILKTEELSSSPEQRSTEPAAQSAGIALGAIASPFQTNPERPLVPRLNPDNTAPAPNR